MQPATMKDLHMPLSGGDSFAPAAVPVVSPPSPGYTLLSTRPTPPPHFSAPHELRKTAWTPQAAAGDSSDEEEDEVTRQTSILMQLTRGASESQAPQHEDGSPPAPVSWTELELSCQKLDAADIRITSLDLSCLGAEDEGTPKSGNPSKSILYNFEVDSSPASSHAGSCISATTPARLPWSAHHHHLPAFSTSASAGHLARSASTESLQDPEPACLTELRKHLAKQGQGAQSYNPEQGGGLVGASYSVLSAPAAAAVVASNSSMPPPVPAVSVQPAQRLPPVVTHPAAAAAAAQGFGDIIPSKPSQNVGAPRLNRTERTASMTQGRALSTQPVEGKHVKNSSFPQDGKPGVLEPRLAQDLFEARRKAIAELEMNNQMKRSECSSLVVPGTKSLARPSKPRTATGFQGLFRTVRSKCGELFTTDKAGKAATAR